jgi:hypothetical protein
MPALTRATIALLLTTLLAATGCVTAPWVPAGGAYTSAAEHYTIDLPEGWMRWTQDENGRLVVTRDGVWLQLIMIERHRVGQPLKHTKKKLATGMMPQEAAEVLLDNFSSNKDVSGLEVKDNRPITISGKPGFWTVVTYKTKDDLKVRVVYCGVLDGEWFYGLRYAAPQRHYFDKDVKTFETMLRSFKLKTTA